MKIILFLKSLKQVVKLHFSILKLSQVLLQFSDKIFIPDLIKQQTKVLEICHKGLIQRREKSTKKISKKIDGSYLV
jgi:hypothetical protein